MIWGNKNWKCFEPYKDKENKENYVFLLNYCDNALSTISYHVLYGSCKFFGVQNYGQRVELLN